MAPITAGSGGNAHNGFTAPQVRERMARLSREATVMKASHSPSPTPRSQPKTTTSKRKLEDITIDLTSDDEDPPPPYQHKVPRLISPKSPVEEQQRRTPFFESRLSLLETPQSPTKMGSSLLKKALDAATSPRSPTGSPTSPIDNTHLKRKRDFSPDLALDTFAFNQATTSPRSPIEEVSPWTPKAARRIIESPASPVEKTASRAAPARRVVESPRSPIEENISPPTPARLESPRSPIEEVAAPVQAPATNNAARPTPASSQKDQVQEHTTVNDRFAPITVEGVEYRNPAKFSVQPPYWRRWDAKTYIKFGEDLRHQFDAVPFARANGIPVEEVQHVFNAVVVNPLYNFKVAAKRGEEGMMRTMRLYQSERVAAIQRPWGKMAEEGGKKQLLGELVGVRRGGVELVLGRSGNEKVIGVGELGERDVKYLRENLREGDKKVLWGDAGEVKGEGE